MADKTLDLSRSVGELVADDPAFADVLAEIGFDEVQASDTLPAVCEQNDIDLALIGVALESYGYDVTGYEPTSNSGSTGAELLEALAALFSGGDDEPSEAAFASVDPVVAHMEAAIRRAEKDGTLPKVSDD